MRAHLVHSQNKHDIYEQLTTKLSLNDKSTTPSAYVSIKASSDIWHDQIGHSSRKITNYIASFNLVFLLFAISPIF